MSFFEGSIIEPLKKDILYMDENPLDLSIRLRVVCYVVPLFLSNEMALLYHKKIV